MNPSQSRRQFLQFITNQASVVSLSPLLLSSLSLTSCESTPNLKAFKGLKPSREDKLLLIEGLNYHLIQAWGDTINKKGETFGFNNDFTSFLPFKGKNTEGLLWVNHESVIPQFIHKKETKQLTRSINEIMREQEMVGGSILHLKKNKEQWSLVKNSPYNRRVHGRTKIPFSNGAKIMESSHAVGTLSNCSGGQTPWRTFLTCEENYDSSYGEAMLIKGKRVLKPAKKLKWNKHFPLAPEHYGWVVEVDPFSGKAEKLILLGRAPHEGATPVVTKKKKTVVYMGEDRPGGYIYKFISEGMHLQAGTLYAADTKNGKWLALDIKKSPSLKKHFKNQLQVLTYAHQAAEAVGATPQDRPEDIEVHKTTGAIFIALTKNPGKGNHYGSLLKIDESKDFDSLSFQSSTWLSGGTEVGMACPDNLCFDRKGNLWVTVDIPERVIGSPTYKAFGNNGLFYIPMSGPGAGLPIQVASAPVDAEFTGPWFSPDYKTLFLSVQHPGSQTAHNMKKPTSTWPDGPGKLPRPGVVAIQGPLFETLMG